jgi:hypothetical protein
MKNVMLEMKQLNRAAMSAVEKYVKAYADLNVEEGSEGYKEMRDFWYTMDMFRDWGEDGLPKDE